MFDLIVKVTRENEDWELDEYLLGALISPLFITWFAYRRWQESAAEVALRLQHEKKLIDIQKTLSYQATHDVLTRLPNRILLTDRLLQAKGLIKRTNKLFAVVYIDLDNFKDINDTYGHEVGDELLVSVAANISQALRENDTVARIGGDEFIAVLTDLSTTAEVVPLLVRILDAVRSPVVLNEDARQVTASLGVAFCLSSSQEDPDQLVRHADQAMYQAKNEGKNNYRFFNEEYEAQAQYHQESLENIRTALANNEFVLFYQPKVNMSTGLVVGAEALIRWQHPEKGLLSPGDFLPLLEGHPLIIDIGEWVIMTALRQIREWRNNGREIPLSVNVDAYQLTQPDFAVRLAELLKMVPDVPTYQLILEIVETSALEDMAHAIRVINDCQRLGVSFSLDDFGTGYSSLTYLKSLPVKELKIDRSFIRDMLVDPDDLAIIKGILSLANAFKLEVVAEGIETTEHGKQLLALGCLVGQGFGIARPMPAAHFQAWADLWEPDVSWTESAA